MVVHSLVENEDVNFFHHASVIFMQQHQCYRTTRPAFIVQVFQLLTYCRVYLCARIVLSDDGNNQNNYSHNTHFLTIIVE